MRTFQRRIANKLLTPLAVLASQARGVGVPSRLAVSGCNGRGIGSLVDPTANNDDISALGNNTDKGAAWGEGV